MFGGVSVPGLRLRSYPLESRWLPHAERPFPLFLQRAACLVACFWAQAFPFELGQVVFTPVRWPIALVVLDWIVSFWPLLQVGLSLRLVVPISLLRFRLWQNAWFSWWRPCLDLDPHCRSFGFSLSFRLCLRLGSSLSLLLFIFRPLCWIHYRCPWVVAMPLGPRHGSLFLRDGRRVQERTRDSRQSLLQGFDRWLQASGESIRELIDIAEPDIDKVNRLLELYGRELFRAGRLYNHYAETLNAVSTRRPRLRRCLQQAWNLLQWHGFERNLALTMWRCRGSWWHYWLRRGFGAGAMAQESLPYLGVVWQGLEKLPQHFGRISCFHLILDGLLVTCSCRSLSPKHVTRRQDTKLPE